MNKKVVLGIVALAVLLVVVIVIVNMFDSSSVTEDAVKTINTHPVKEFAVESFTEMIEN